MRISLILAIATNGTIGRNNSLPWHLPADLKRFKQLTIGHPIVMGRRTFESIGKPLPKRHNIVVTSKPETIGSTRVTSVSSLAAALDVAAETGEREEAFVIGGAKLFAEALELATRLYLTRIDAQVDGDVKFDLPDLEHGWRLVDRIEHLPDERHTLPFSFETYDRNESVLVD